MSRDLLLRGGRIVDPSQGMDTVGDDWAAQHLLALGTDGIITDRVDLFSPT